MELEEFFPLKFLIMFQTLAGEVWVFRELTYFSQEFLLESFIILLALALSLRKFSRLRRVG